MSRLPTSMRHVARARAAARRRCSRRSPRTAPPGRAAGSAPIAASRCSPPTLSKKTSMPSGAAAGELLGDRAVVVVEGGGEAELVGQPAHLLRASRRCRRPPTRRAAGRTGRPGCRPRRRRRRRRRRRPGRNAATPEEPGPGGQPRHPEHAQVVARRDAGQLRQHPHVRARRGRRRRARPASASTSAPSGTSGERESTTRPTAPPFIVSPTSHGGGVGLPGAASGRACTGRPTSPASGRRPARPAGSGCSTSTSRKSSGVGSPCGRAASCHSRVVTGTVPILPRPYRGLAAGSRCGGEPGWQRGPAPRLGACCSPGSRRSRSRPRTRCPAAPSRSRTCPRSTPSTATASSRRSPTGMQTAVFGAGCFWGVEKVFWETPGVYSTAAGYAGGFTPEPDVRGGLLGAHRAHRGRPGRLRPGGHLLRAAAQGVLGGPRPDPGHAPGQRRRHPVPLGDLLRDAGAGGGRAGHPRRVPGAADGGRLRRHHHRDRAAGRRSTTPRTTTSSTSTRCRNGYCPVHSTGVSCPVGLPGRLIIDRHLRRPRPAPAGARRRGARTGRRRRHRPAAARRGGRPRSRRAGRARSPSSTTPTAR